MSASKKILKNTKKTVLKSVNNITKKTLSPKKEVKPVFKKKAPKKTENQAYRKHLLSEMVDIEREHIQSNRTHHIIETLLLSIVVLLVLILISLVWFFGEGAGGRASTTIQSPVQQFSIQDIAATDVVSMQGTVVAGHNVDIPAHWSIDSEFYSQKNEINEVFVSVIQRYVPSVARDPMRDFIVHGSVAADCKGLVQYGLCVEQYQLATGSSDPQVLSVFANMVAQLKAADENV